MLAQAFPEEACEVAQQLARWPLYDAQVWPLLRLGPQKIHMFNLALWVLF